MAGEFVLIVDDEEGIRESLTGILKDEGYRAETAASGEEALKFIATQTPELIFLDIWMPGIDGIETLSQIKEALPDIPVVMISGHGNIETALKATRLGAYDFLEKPLSLDRVLLVAKNALEGRRLRLENLALRENLGKKWMLVGESPAIKAIRSQIEIAARSNSRVLITGESGTGKEIAARLLHEQSPRARKPFIEVNCAAIPQELIESELFGHEKGSFTGAIEQKKGKFELAHEGTLFLDEIADMSFPTQAKLLRVLENQQFQRVGGSKSISVDVRVIAATNKNIEVNIKEERFRGDLYYRLNVIPIIMPPLRERKEDIPLLIEHFLRQLASEYGQAQKKVSQQVLNRLSAGDWPGNVRELRNLIERLVIMTPGDTIDELCAGAVASSEQTDESFFAVRTIREARDAFEKEFIIRKLGENNWNVSRTAEVLEIERSNLHRKIKAYEIKLP